MFKGRVTGCEHGKQLVGDAQGVSRQHSKKSSVHRPLDSLLLVLVVFIDISDQQHSSKEPSQRALL